MPINVGEVNATIRLNVAKEQVAEAEQRLAQLQKEFAAAGGSATEAGRAIYASGMQQVQAVKQAQEAVDQWTAALAALKGQAAPASVAANNLGGAAAACAAAASAAAPAIASVAAAAAPAATALAAVQAQAAPAAAGLANVQNAANAAGGGLSNLDNLATRMVQRLIILYAMRESFDFVKGLFTGAEAMEALHKQTGMSTEKLQEFEMAGEKVDIPVTKLDTAINHLQKNLAEFHGGDELHELGLSFEQIFALNPDQQLDAIMTALQGVSSQATRARIETKLFGSDAIDPLVQQYVSLTKAVRDSGMAMEGQTISALAQTSRMYKQLGEDVSHYAAKVIEWGQNSDRWIDIPLVALGKALTGDTAAAKIMIEEMFGVKVAIDAVHQAAAKPVPPLMGQAFIDSLRVESKLTDEQQTKLLQLNAIHELTAANAMRAANVTSDQYRAFIKDLEASNKAAKQAETAAEQLDAAWKEVNSAGEDLNGTLAKMTAEQIATTQQLLQAGVSHHAIALALGETATQVKAVAEELKGQEAAWKKAEAAAAHAAEVERKAEIDAAANWEQYFDMVDSRSGTSRDKQVAAIETWLARKIAAAEKAKNVDQDYYNSLYAIATEKMEAIIQKNNDMFQFSRQHYEDEAKVAKDRLDDILAHSEDYTGHEIALATKMYNEKLKQSAHWRDQANKDVDDHYNHEQKRARKAADEVMLLDDEIVTHAEANKRRLAGSSFTYDLTTPEGLAQFHKLNPAATSQWSDAQIQEFAKKGGTLQQLIEKAIINLYGGYLSGPFGGIPHAADGVKDFGGGAIMVGEEGPEVLNLPKGSSVTPLPALSAGGGGNTVTNHIYVNGTAAEVARKVSDEIMRTLKFNRRFGAA